jgi:basic membrane protein A and related proteins
VSAGLERLTRRELEVAVLVADGLSDREVADKLFVTKRTAEWHVQQILAKLDLKSRSQIAARVSQAEALGYPLLAADRLPPDLPAQLTAFIGWNPEVSQTNELLATTRLLGGPPVETDAQRQERLISLAEAGYNPVIVRFTYTVALGEIAKRYPNTQFAIVDDASLSADNRNVTSLVFADHQGSYLVGAIAAQASTTGIVGFVGGVHVPFIEKFQAGYAAGARVVNPKIRLLVDYLTEPPDFSGFAHPARAKVSADRMYRGGADVVYHAAGSGQGVFHAAKVAGAVAIGVDSDQYMTAPADVKPFILTSMVKRVEVAVNEYVQAYARKAPLPGVNIFDLARGGVDYAKSNPLVQPYVALAEDLREQIVAGNITVPEKP